MSTFLVLTALMGYPSEDIVTAPLEPAPLQMIYDATEEDLEALELPETLLVKANTMEETL